MGQGTIGMGNFGTIGRGRRPAVQGEGRLWAAGVRWLPWSALRGVPQVRTGRRRGTRGSLSKEVIRRGRSSSHQRGEVLLRTTAQRAPRLERSGHDPVRDLADGPRCSLRWWRARACATRRSKAASFAPSAVGPSQRLTGAGWSSSTTRSCSMQPASEGALRSI